MRLPTSTSSRTPDQSLSHVADPFMVVPRHAAGVEVRETADGEYHLRKKYPPRPGILSALRRRLGWKHECFYNLDARGSEFWRMIDGRRTLRDIGKLGAARWGVTEKDARAAATFYVRQLMLRNLVVLEVPERSMEVGEDER